MLCYGQPYIPFLGGFLRSGELTVPSDAAFDPGAHVCFSDVSLDSVTKPQVLKIRLKASKTDPFGKGVDIVLVRTNDGRCPISAVLAYLAVRGNAPGFLFRFKDDGLLTKHRFITSVREALASLGLNPIWAATTAGACGIGDATIKMLGRWESSAYQLYIRTPRDELARFSLVLDRHESIVF